MIVFGDAYFEIKTIEGVVEGIVKVGNKEFFAMMTAVDLMYARNIFCSREWEWVYVLRSVANVNYRSERVYGNRRGAGVRVYDSNGIERFLYVSADKNDLIDGKHKREFKITENNIELDDKAVIAILIRGLGLTRKILVSNGILLKNIARREYLQLSMILVAM